MSARTSTWRWRVAALALLPTAALYGTYRIANARSWQAFGPIVARVETREPVIALTFDDGPSPKPARALLDILAERRVHATFFLEGRQIERYPETTRALVQAGHELGNHSFSHRRMVLKTPAFIADEIERTDRAIRACGFTGPIHFRPPYGKKLLMLPWYLARHGRTTITWDVEPELHRDVGASPARMAEDVLAHARPGSIILMHVMHAFGGLSLAAVPRIIDGLRARGFRFVRVSELLASAETP